MSTLGATQIRTLFEALNAQLASKSSTGELYVVGGAVMCLVFDARPATRDVDAYFRPAQELRDAAVQVARERGLPENWLNDSVKGFLSADGAFNRFLELSHLRVFCALPEYLLAMKCLAFGIGAELHNEADIRYLLRYLNIESYAEAVAIITRYYPLERFPQKTLYALEELLE